MKTTTVVCANCGHTNRLPAAAAGKPKCGNCHEPLPWVASSPSSTPEART